MTEYKSSSATSPASADCGVPAAEFAPVSLEDRVNDFLDGRTHGGELLHALYDYVLDEPIPERMRSLFKN
jgi:hypothetical protein